MFAARWSLALVLPVAGFAYACGSLDKEPNDDHNGLRNQQPFNVLAAADSGICSPIDAGACSVSYATDIAPLFEASACWNVGCHLDKPLPRMKKDDLQGTWDSLRRHINPVAKRPYINPCTTDVDASYIVDNLKGEVGLQMPIGQPMTPTNIEKIRTWLACGSPYN